jgi:hypothetical protein
MEFDALTVRTGPHERKRAMIFSVHRMLRRRRGGRIQWCLRIRLGRREWRIPVERARRIRKEAGA